jgi:hypothetical protein
LPVSEAAHGPFVALLANEMLAEDTPLACGVKLTVKVALWPAAIVAGSDNPLTVNSGLLETAEDTVTLAPLAVRVPVLFWLAPTVTSPKVKVPGATASWPGLVPVPLNDNERLGTAPSAVSARLPLALPLVVGVNTTLNVRL